MRRKIVIIGTGGLAREVAMVIEQINALNQRWDLCGFITDRPDEVGKDLGIASIIGDDNWILEQDFQSDIALGIGYPKLRAKVLTRYLAQPERFHFPNLVHPTVTLDYHRVELGQGNVLAAGCRFTCDISVHDFNLFNLNVTVGHDVVVGSYNVINPGANISGGVVLKNRILVGTGSQILENMEVGNDAIIGASALVRTFISEGQTRVGVPARPVRK